MSRREDEENAAAHDFVFFRIDSPDDVWLKLLEKRAGIDSISDLELDIEATKDFGDVFMLKGIWDQIYLDKAFGGGG